MSRRKAKLVLAALAMLSLTAFVAARVAARRSPLLRNPEPPVNDDGSLVLVTGYCNCGKCCGWKRNWFGFGEPVYNYGPNKGKPKKIGVTASGAPVKHGTVAADTKRYAFGTRLEIPGYGTGTVEDVGGSIKGRHIDVWFPSHADARRWGARWLKVRKLDE